MIARQIGFFVFVLAALTLCEKLPALAITEYCPAGASLRAVDDIGGRHQEYAFRLDAHTARSVTGALDIVTKEGDWYQVPFEGVELKRYLEHYTWRNGVTFERVQYQSDPLFVRFPKPINIDAYAVARAQTTGELGLGWDSKGLVDCGRAVQTPPNATSPSTPNPQIESVHDDNPLPLPSLAPAGVQYVVAQPTSSPNPGRTDCATPFANARVKHAVSPNWPDGLVVEKGFAATTLVEVAIGSSGEIDDAWIYAPSGVAVLDDAAVAGARVSTYAPRLQYCEPIPSVYIYKADFFSP